MSKIAAILIVKATDDEADHVNRCLDSIDGFVDGIFINLNHKAGHKPSKKVKDVIAKYTTNVITTEWTDNFAEARNANLAQVPEDYDWCLWLDSDDSIDKPQKIKDVAEASANYDSVYVDYVYDRDEAGNPMTVHMVARMFKNNGGHQWKGRIHETLIETRSVNQGMTKDFIVIHHADDKRKDRSLERNIKLLQRQLEDEQKDPDPRTFYYLGSTYIDAGHPDLAKQLLEDYLTMSGWDQERSAAETKIGRLWLEENNHSEAKKHFMQAIGEDPNNPEPRVEMGSLELEMKQYHKARLWLEGVEAMEKLPSTLERNPLSYTYRTYLLLADTYLNIGGKYLEKALDYAKKALKYKKKDKNTKSYVKMIESVVADKHLTTSFLELVKVLKKNKEDDKIELLARAVPKQLEDNPLVVKLRDSKPYKWPPKSVVIMTGDTALEAWGPWSLKEGIGGSEEAVIRISKHLNNLGYKVVIFGKPGADAGLHEGVMWRNFWECNLEDEFDIFIAWRAPFLFEKKINARKSYLWMHDVMEPGEFTPNRIANFTKCILLSKYHRSLFPMIPEQKVLMSGNGIDPEEFEGYENVKRDPHKILYASSHVRGLVYLYEIWNDVKAAVPTVTLDVYYGRESYDAVHKGNPERMKWMDDMQQKAKDLEGVTDHGKVSQQKIVEEGFKSGIWAYPCVTGDTLVDMPRDYQKYPLGVPIRKLVGKKNFPVWSYKEETGKFELKNVNWVAKTREKAAIIKINWTDGTSLRCTPDHKVYTYKRGWVAAKELQINESVVALKKHMMVQVSAGQGKWPYEHRMIAEYALGEIPKGYHIDHIDGNCFNNEPGNLQILSPSDHAAKTYKEQYSTKPLIERRKANLARYRATDRGKKQLSEIGRKRSQGFWDGMSLEERAAFVARRNAARYNHKVESIETAGNEDVFDMNVDDNHSFIAGGVVVHNCPFPEIYCITAIKSQASGAVPVASNYAALDETIQFGHKQSLGEFDKDDLEKYKQALIWWLQHPEEQEKVRPEMMAWAKTVSWLKTANGWVEDFEL